MNTHLMVILFLITSNTLFSAHNSSLDWKQQIYQALTSYYELCINEQFETAKQHDPHDKNIQFIIAKKRALMKRVQHLERHSHSFSDTELLKFNDLKNRLGQLQSLNT